MKKLKARKFWKPNFYTTGLAESIDVAIDPVDSALELPRSSWLHRFISIFTLRIQAIARTT
jgi:hypothetical protein